MPAQTEPVTKGEKNMKKYIGIALAAVLLAIPQLTDAQTKTKSAAQKPALDRSIRPQAAPAPEINIGKYESFKLDNGLNVFVVENHKIPRVTYSLILDYNQVPEGELAGMADMCGQLLRTGTTSLSKDQLDEEVDFIGASLNTSASGIYASALKKHNDKLLELMSDVLLNPAFRDEELAKLKTQAISGLKATQNDPSAISDRISKMLVYGREHPYGESMSEKSVSNLSTEHCRAFYDAFFKPNVAYLAIVGDITLQEAKELTQKHFGTWQAGEVIAYNPPKPRLPERTAVAIVDRPDAVQTTLRVGYAVDLKPGAPDAIKARVMNTILGGGTFRLFNNLREDKAYTYGAYSQLSADKLAGRFNVNTEIRNPVTDSALNEIFYEMKLIREEQVGDEELNLVKNYLNGNFALSLENPQTVANFAINTARYKLPADYYANYMKSLAAVTADDVRDMAVKYILPDNSYILAVGKAADIAPKLEKFTGGKAIRYFDNNGKEYDPNTKVKPAPEGMTAQMVNRAYINAIGGEKALKKVKDVTMMATTNMQGMAIGFDFYRKAPNKYKMQIGAGEMIFQKITFDGTAAKLESPMGGENKMVEGEELEALKMEATLFPELQYDALGIALTLEGVEEIEGTETYRLLLTYPSGKQSTQFYDIKTGLKIMESGEQGSVNYGDYRAVNGVKFPFAMTQQMGPQSIDLNILSVKVNSKLKDDLFSVK